MVEICTTTSQMVDLPSLNIGVHVVFVAVPSVCVCDDG